MIDILDTIGEAEMASGRPENGLVLATAATNLAERLEVAAYAADGVDAYIAARDRAAEQRLSTDAATAARDRGRAMTYGEAVDAALAAVAI